MVNGMALRLSAQLKLSNRPRLDVAGISRPRVDSACTSGNTAPSGRRSAAAEGPGVPR